MANNVAFSGAGIINAAVMHLSESDYKGPIIGALGAVRSPSQARILKEVNPLEMISKNGGDRNIAWEDNGSGDAFLRVKTHFTPQIAGTTRTTRTGLGTVAVGTNGLTGITQPATPITVTFDKNLEIEVEQKFTDYQCFKTPVYIDYISKIAAGKIDLNGVIPNEYRGTHNDFSQLGMTIVTRLNNNILKPLNDVVLTELLAGVGKNAETPTANLPSANAPFPQVVAFENDGRTPAYDLALFIKNSKIKNRINGKMIVVGGNMLLNYFNTKEYVATANSGFVLDKIIDGTRFEFWYDDRADAIFGQNKCVMFDTEAICMPDWLKHGNDPRINVVTVKHNANMHYGNMQINLAQYNDAFLNDPMFGNSKNAAMTLNFDTRVLEGRSATDYPLSNIGISFSYGFFTRPRGFYAQAADFFFNYTGIMGFELINRP